MALLWLSMHLAIALMSSASTAPISPQVVTQTTVSLIWATEIAQAAVRTCQVKGFAVTAVVVDRAGNLKAVLRSDGSVPVSIESARRKAVTALNFGMSTVTLLQAMKGNTSSFAGLPDTLVAPGGVPITVGGEIVGAVGVGGATAIGGDEACAMAAIETAHHG